jgi:hypothetical protein
MSGDFFFKHGENAMTDDPLDAQSCPRAIEDQPDPSSAGLQVVLASDFAQHGADAVKALRLERPHDYLKLVAAFMPKNLPPANPTVEDMTDDEFIRVLNALRPRAPGGGSAPDGDGA